jgi:aspartate aminotransferase
MGSRRRTRRLRNGAGEASLAHHDRQAALLGHKCPRPHGAFYVFPNITGTGFSAKPLADRLLDEAGVACLSGTAFGEWGEGHLRFSYAASLENIQEALRRIKDCLAR